jgi:poly(3-hydroxybutyrate) depolymerase
MLYQAYQAHADLMVAVRALASLAAGRLDLPYTKNFGIVHNVMAACELIARAKLTHHRPAFGIETVLVGNREVAVREEAAHVTPFGTLLHFRKD